jgi:hypothetical protein
MFSQLKNSATRHPFFLVLMPAFVLGHVHNSYHHLVDYRFVWREVLLLFALPFIMWLLAAAGFRSRMRASLFLLPFLYLFLFGGLVKSWLDLHGGRLLSSYVFWLPVLLLLFGFLVLRIRRRGTYPSRWLLLGNTIALAWLLMEGVGFLAERNNNDLADTGKHLSNSYQGSRRINKPDIYYLLFDGYTSAPVQHLLGRDPFDLQTYLQQEGFTIDAEARSNYNFTAFSIGSIFNLDTLQRIDTMRKYFDYDYLPAVYTVFQSEWPRLLKREGYTFENYSIFDFEGAPTKLPSFDIWYQSYLFRQYNFFDRLNRDIGWHLPASIRLATSFADADFANGRRLQLEFLQKQLPSLARNNTGGPRFFYAHYLVPHAPYTYDSSGNYRPEDPKESIVTGYLRQSAWCDKLIREAVASIKAAATPGRPIVIILQGDHGLRFYEPARKQLSFAALDAVYCSDGPWISPPGNSHVNTFRILANRYFGKNYPMLPPKTFYLRDQ